MGFQAKADKQGQLELRSASADDDSEDDQVDDPSLPEGTTPENETPAGTDGSSSPRMRLVDNMADAIDKDNAAKVA